MILKKIVTTEVAYNNKNVFLIVLEAAKSKIDLADIHLDWVPGIPISTLSHSLTPTNTHTGTLKDTVSYNGTLTHTSQLTGTVPYNNTHGLRPTHTYYVIQHTHLGPLTHTMSYNTHTHTRAHSHSYSNMQEHTHTHIDNIM